MQTKFQIGDVLIRSAYKDSKSKLMRDECQVLNIVCDSNPFFTSVWYITIDSKNQTRQGLQSVMEECFEKVC